MIQTIDSETLAQVTGGAERGTYERAFGRVGSVIGSIAGAPLGPAGRSGGAALVGGYGAQLGRAIDNPQPGPTGGVNGGDSAQPTAP